MTVSTEDNKAVIRRFIEDGWNKHDPSVINELVAPDWGGSPENAERYKKSLYESLFVALPDSHATIEFQVAEGERVVTRHTITATHQGEYLGVPPTGKRVTITNVCIDTVRDGRIVAGEGEGDYLGLLAQLRAD